MKRVRRIHFSLKQELCYKMVSKNEKLSPLQLRARISSGM